MKSKVLCSGVNQVQRDSSGGPRAEGGVPCADLKYVTGIVPRSLQTKTHIEESCHTSSRSHAHSLHTRDGFLVRCAVPGSAVLLSLIDCCCTASLRIPQVISYSIHQ